MTIYEIKRIHLEAFPHSHFFDRNALRFFGQTMKSFHVYKTDKGYRISAPMIDRSGVRVGVTERFFDVTTGELLLRTDFKD